MDLKNAIKLILPPMILIPRQYIIRVKKERQLLRSGLFRQCIERASAYGEYGCGRTTVWVANNTNMPVMSVYTSQYWKEKVNALISRTKNVTVEHIDVGELAEWGRPRTYQYRERFQHYVEAPWKHSVKPDFILVDGRFRVACFLYSLLEASECASILFDDYTLRAEYGIVEEFCKVSVIDGTQALFHVRNRTNRDRIEGELQRFLYVLD